MVYTQVCSKFAVTLFGPLISRVVGLLRLSSQRKLDQVPCTFADKKKTLPYQLDMAGFFQFLLLLQCLLFE